MFINLDQGSPAWHKWRNSRICASDVAVIMGKSKFNATPYTLWQQKKGFLPPIEDNYILRKGRETEIIVRDEINEKEGTNYQPVCCECDEAAWLGASLDGYDLGTNTILEIKLVGYEDHKLAIQGKIPEAYMYQVQTQLLCSGVKEGFYASRYEDDTVIVPFVLDNDFMVEPIVKTREFYENLVKMIPPELNEDDYIQIDDEEFKIAAQDWLDASRDKKEADAREKEAKARMAEFTDDSNCEGFGFRMTRVNRAPSIQYAKMWEAAIKKFPDIEKELDPKNFSKKSIGYWKITPPKES